MSRGTGCGRLPPSLYADTARPAPLTPPLRGECRVDVAVVGGGITGLSSALHLAERGIGVAVLETHAPGWGASGRNGGQVNPGLKWEPDRVEADLGPERGHRLVAFSGGAPQKVFDLIEAHRIRCEAEQAGTIRAAFTAGAAEELRRASAGWQRRGAPVAFLERRAVAAATGTDRYLCAALDQRGGSVNPLGYVRGLAEAALRAGAAIHGDSLALAVERRGDRWAVRTAGGTLLAEWLVLATNGYTDDLWPALRRSLVPVYSGIIASEPLPASLARRILPGRPVLYEHEAITVYYRLDPANRLLMGGRSRLRPLKRPESFPELKRYAGRLWPFLGDVKWRYGWNGRLAITTDHYPHLHEPARNVIACLGYNGRGIAMATAMGGEIARRVGGAAADDLALPITTLHPIPFHRLWPVGASARIAYGRIRMALGL